MTESYRKVPGLHGGFTVEPMPSSAELADLCREEYYQRSASVTYALDYSQDELAWKRLKCDLAIHLLQRQDLTEGRLIDLGSGEGFLVEAALRAGLDAYGVDFSDFGVERFHPQLRDRISAGEVTCFLEASVAEGVLYDAFTLQHLVEHVREPQLLLERVGECLPLGGLALVTVPNDENLVQHLAIDAQHIETEFWFAPPQHLHYFDTSSAVALAQAAGFDVLDVFTDFPIDVYLPHPGSNYVRDPGQGKSAHRARVEVELTFGRQRLDLLRDLGAAQARCGIGRDLTMVLRRGDR